MKKVLFISNYYYPYISGMTEYIRLLAEELVNDYDVTILTSNHDKLKSEEEVNGVKVVRANIICKISKGTVSYEFIKLARTLANQADIVNLHLPMLESSILSLIIDNKKIVTTYHCDLNLPNGLVNNFIKKAMDISNSICIENSMRVICTSLDYARNSRIMNKYIDKVDEISPPIKKLNRVDIEKEDVKIIGFCGRIVEEKGIDVLIKAFNEISKNRKDVKLIIGGDYKNIAGGSIYESLKKYIQDNSIENVEFIGKIPEEKMEEFYSKLDVFILPSINSLEAFGMVQVEAMICGTPVVASNLPGVRTIIQNTGMGLVCEVNDFKDLADCIERVIDNKEKYIKTRDEIESMYSLKAVVKKHITCFERIENEKR